MEFRKNNLNRFVSSITFLLILGFIFYSCSKDDGNVVYGPSTYAIDTTILRTDETGRILGGDYTDWCFNDSSSHRTFGPAYPNPADGSTNINFAVPQNDTLSLYFYNGSDSIFVIKRQILNAGYYTVHIDASTLGFYNTIRRLYIRNNRGLLTGSSSCKNYGDIYFR